MPRLSGMKERIIAHKPNLQWCTFTSMLRVSTGLTGSRKSFHEEETHVKQNKNTKITQIFADVCSLR